MSCMSFCRKVAVALPVVVALIFQRYCNPINEFRSALLSKNTAVAWNTNRSYLPKLQLQQPETCTKENMYVRVCVLRKAIDSSALEAFLRANGNGSLSYIHEYSSGNEPASFHRINVRPDIEAEGAATVSTVDELLAGTVPFGYKSFGAFNYSSFTHLVKPVEEQGLFDGVPDRADIFAGWTSMTMNTAPFHANQLEKSTTVQVMGEKLWHFVTPWCYLNEMKAYHIGLAFIAFADMSMEALERCTLQSTITGPGDVIIFPKAWPHQTFTIPGPNFMVNIRTDDFDVYSPSDVLAGFFALLGKFGSVGTNFPLRCNPKAELAPTAFVHGAPKGVSVLSKKKQAGIKASRIDFRNCFSRAPAVDRWGFAQQLNGPTKEVEAAIWEQLEAFHGRDLV